MNTGHIDDRALALVALDDSDAEKVAAVTHARGCSPCASELARARRILAFIDALPAPGAPSAETIRRVSASVAMDMSIRHRLAFAIASAFTGSRVKAWYLSGAIVVQGLLSIYAASQTGASLLHGEPWIAWAAALLGVAAFPARIASYYLRPTPRTSKRLLGLIGVAALAFAVSVAGPRASGLPPAFAALGLASVLYYVFVYSSFGRRPSASLAVGKPLPSFVLEDYDGNAVESRRYAGAPVVFMFVRGNWCPLCVAQIREIAMQYRQLDRLGAKVVLVSAQPRRNVRDLSRRFDVPFDFLVDEGGRAARALGIVDRGGLPAGLELFGYEKDTVLPTVVIADRAGRIVFNDQTDNYRVRPEPATFLNALGSVG